MESTIRACVYGMVFLLSYVSASEAKIPKPIATEIEFFQAKRSTLQRVLQKIDSVETQQRLDVETHEYLMHFFEQNGEARLFCRHALLVNQATADCQKWVIPVSTQTLKPYTRLIADTRIFEFSEFPSLRFNRELTLRWRADTEEGQRLNFFGSWENFTQQFTQQLSKGSQNSHFIKSAQYKAASSPPSVRPTPNAWEIVALSTIAVAAGMTIMDHQGYKISF